MKRNPGAAVTIAKLIPDFASLHPGYLLPQFENLRTFLALADKQRIMAALSYFPRSHIKQRAKKILIGSEGWLSVAEFLELARCGELKKSVSLILRDVNR